MRILAVILTSVLLSACIPRAKTFETNLVRESFYEDGTSVLLPFSTNLHDTVHVADIEICSYLREARWRKDIQFSSLHLDAITLQSDIINAADSLMRKNTSSSLSTQMLTSSSFNECDFQKADSKWTDFIAYVLSRSSSIREGMVGMKLVGRIVTYSAPQLADTFSPHIMTSSGNTEYYVSIRWCVIVYEGSKEVYRGNSLYKDFLIYPDSIEFSYIPTRQSIDSLLNLSMREYFRTIK